MSKHKNILLSGVSKINFTINKEVSKLEKHSWQHEGLAPRSVRRWCSCDEHARCQSGKWLTWMMNSNLQYKTCLQTIFVRSYTVIIFTFVVSDATWSFPKSDHSHGYLYFKWDYTIYCMMLGDFNESPAGWASGQLTGSAQSPVDNECWFHRIQRFRTWELLTENNFPL